MPAGEVALQFAGLSPFGPGLDLPAVLLDDAHAVHEFAAAQVVVHEVLAWPPPGGGHGPHEPRRQAIGGHESTPCDATREGRCIRAEHGGPRSRVDAVGTDEQRTAVADPACLDRHRIGHLRDARDACVRVEGDAGFGPRRLDQDRDQVRPVDVVDREPERPQSGLAEWIPEEDPAALPVAHLHALGNEGMAQERGLESQVVEHAGAVRTQLDARADLRERRHLLEYMYIEALLREAEGRGQAADAAAGNEHGQAG